MKTKNTPKTASKGVCNFCKGEFAKSTISQHLHNCKEHKAILDALSADKTKRKKRLLHIQAEGRYKPQYWVHLEMPADATLDDLDDFLRTLWFEHFEHLSGFTIDGTSYSSEGPSFYFSDEEEEDDDEDGEDGEDNKDGEDGEDDDFVDGEELLDEIDSRYVDAFPPDLLAEIKKKWFIYDLIAFLKENLKIVEAQKRALRNTNERERFSEVYKQFQGLGWMIDIIEDRSTYAPLQYVLKVGQKFSYTYDYGTSTDLTLRVVSEREGIVRDEKESVELLARNISPEFLCVVCNKPATRMISGYYSGEERVYCNKCAKGVQEEDTYQLVKIKNTPRVGLDE